MQFVLEIDLEKEIFFGIGLVRNQEYIGLYFNLTAWNLYNQGMVSFESEQAPTNIIRISLRMGSESCYRVMDHKLW